VIFADSCEARSSRISDKMEYSPITTYVFEEVWCVNACFQLPLRAAFVASPDLEIHLAAAQAFLFIELWNTFIHITSVQL
jgi:hypothetical protein